MQTLGKALAMLAVIGASAILFYTIVGAGVAFFRFLTGT